MAMATSRWESCTVSVDVGVEFPSSVDASEHGFERFVEAVIVGQQNGAVVGDLG